MRLLGFLLGAALLFSAPETADELAPLRAACEAKDLQAGELTASLQAVIQGQARAIGPVAGCSQIALSAPGEPPVILVAHRREGKGAVLWLQGPTWRASVVEDFGPALELLRQAPHELFVADRSPGSGGLGRILVLRRYQEGWVTVTVTDWVGHFRAAALDDDHILVTGRRGWGDAPLLWSANCCAPTNHQWLYKRHGPDFVVAAERDAPDPYQTLNVFFGALRAEDPEWAAHWLGVVADTRAVIQARRLQLDQKEVAIELGDGAQEILWQIRLAEERHWSVLPPALNGPPPAQKSVTIPLRSPDPGVQVTLRRDGTGWRVASLQQLAHQP